MEMTNREMKEFLDYLDEHGLEVTAEAFGMTTEEIRDIYPAMELLDSKDGEEIVSEWEPDYSKTAEYEGAGITADLTPADSLVGAGVEEVMAYGEANGWNPALLGILAAISTKGKSLKKTPKLEDKGMLHTPKMKKTKNEPFKTSKSGEVVGKPTSNVGKAKVNAKSGQSMQKRYGDADKNTKQLLPPTSKGGALATRKIDETRKFGLTDKNKWRAGAGIATGVAIDQAYRGLTGDRDETGTLKPAPKPEVVTPEASENQFGYHKQEGQNFWTVDNDDSYWDTHEMGTGDAWSDAELKKEPAQELDWSSWFN